ncbi:hypothetical protein DH2020_045075 [Rehmannia glutinosa]|uniref:Uncharacterized protein n=1 Tax=Rehmannia glutinosa TaxID=99300 RepID=A0ABR0UFR0_REHGL
MSLSLCFTPLLYHPKPRIPLYKSIKISARPKLTHSRFTSSANCGVNENFENLAAVVPCDKKPRWENWLSTAASLYPLYVTVGGVVAFFRPSTFSWFVNLGPTSYSLTLGFIMLAMGITLELKELISLFRQRPLSGIAANAVSDIVFGKLEAILYGCAAQYTIMPAFGLIVSKLLGLSPSLSVGLILLSCCPGGTASNVVTLIAQGDVPLSIVMTVCTTLGAVILTPLLCKILAGTYVPVNAVNLSVSTLQVVVAPILLENVVRLKSSVFGASLSSDLSPIHRAQAMLSGELGVVVLSVLLLHFAGFFVGYLSAAFGGFKEQQRRAISIEVGMQNSSLGVVLASSHFSSPMVALPSAISAVIMNIMGSSLSFFWRYIDPSEPKDGRKTVED